MLAISLGETVLHAYDLATALGRPWPIDPGHAAVVLAGYLPVMHLVLNPATTTGHTARYLLELRGAGTAVIAFADGAYSCEAPGAEPVDCEISVDPVAHVLVATGRMSRWPAIALGLVSAGGTRPELAAGFADLFICV